MTKDEIKKTQRTVGVLDDGFWGNKSNLGTQKYLRGFMPAKHPAPASDQTSLRKFFGDPGDESKLVNLPVPQGVVVLYEGKAVKTILCHAKIAEPLTRVLVELNTFEEGRAILKRYAGCYNNRSVRGGSVPSLHAYGAALDFDPDNNGNHTHWPTGATMPLSVMVVFARHGFLPAGAFWNRDAMHFQFTK